METEDPLAGIWNDLPLTDDVDENLAWYRRLTRVQQVIYSTSNLTAEVYNGGFHQYFDNSSGLNAPEAADNFQELGLDDVADLVKEAMLVFGSDFPRDREARQAFLEAIPGDEPSEWNPFFLLDDRFYEIIKIPGAPPLHDEDRLTVALKNLVVNADS